MISRHPSNSNSPWFGNTLVRLMWFLLWSLWYYNKQTKKQLGIHSSIILHKICKLNENEYFYRYLHISKFSLYLGISLKNNSSRIIFSYQLRQTFCSCSPQVIVKVKISIKQFQNKVIFKVPMLTVVYQSWKGTDVLLKKNKVKSIFPTNTSFWYVLYSKFSWPTYP